MELFLFGVLVSVITVALSLVGLFLARKFTDLEARRENNQVADPLLQVIGTLYAVLLGLLVVQAMETFDEARHNVEREAVALADTFRLSEGLPRELRIKLQNSCLDYAAAVVTDEWEDMQDRDTCDRAWEEIDKMWHEVISFEPQTVREKYLYPELLVAAKTMNDCRRSRLVTSRSRVSPILWLVLITGAASTIVFTYTFGIRSLKAQMFMTSMVAITISLNLYLWAIYSNPFYGLLRVEPEAFIMDMEHFQFYFDNPDEQRWHKFDELKKSNRPLMRRSPQPASQFSKEKLLEKKESDPLGSKGTTEKTPPDNSGSDESLQKEKELIPIPSDFSQEQTNE